MTMQIQTTCSASELEDSLRLMTFGQAKFSVKNLKAMLTGTGSKSSDIETILFFGKLYELNHVQLGQLLNTLVNTPLTQALFGEQYAHSTSLQGYLVDVANHVPDFNAGDLVFEPEVAHGEILAEVWKAMEVEVAQSIKAVASKLTGVVNAMPGKEGTMLFKSMLTLNKQRPVLGQHKAHIHHERQSENLLILDVSGSMTEGTIRRIIEDVVGLAYNANAHLAIVSNTCTYWTPGTYDVNAVLGRAEYGGTRYEQLTPLFDRDWGVVVTVADYDSSHGAFEALSRCQGRIDKVLDLSLVNRPTFLAECVGQLAAEVEPLLVASTHRVLAS